MAMNFQPLILIILSFSVAFLLFDVSSVIARPVVGGWQPIKDLKDPTVQEIGQFAITEHNKQVKTNLKFENVVKGDTEVVAGMNYRVVIAARDGAAGSNNYEAIVWDMPWLNFRNLTSFIPLN